MKYFLILDMNLHTLYLYVWFKDCLVTKVITDIIIGFDQKQHFYIKHLQLLIIRIVSYNEGLLNSSKEGSSDKGLKYKN